MAFLLLPVILIGYSYSFCVGCYLDFNNVHFSILPTDLSLEHGFININLLYGTTAYPNCEFFALTKTVRPCKRDLGLLCEPLELATMNEIFRAGKILSKS